VSKTVIIVLAALGGSCVLCGGAAMVLGLAADGDSTSPAAPASGEHPAELVGFWSCGSQKLALFPDGTAKRWYRHHWNGQYGGDTCLLEADLEGTWSASGPQLTVELTEGRWVSCRGEETFTAKTDTYAWRHEFASGIGKKVMWLKNSDQHEDGYNLECESPSGCSFEPMPLK